MFVAVSGRWRVPEIALPTEIGNAKDGEIIRSCSTWIGLDGARNHVHSSLPQMGTIQRVVVKNGQPVAEYFSFREWWCDGHRSEPIRLSLPVNPGDNVACTLTVVSFTKVRFWMKNLDSKEETGGLTFDAPNLPARRTSSPFIQRLISGQTAQWITERPSSPKSHDTRTGQAGKPYVLANYGEVVFDQCSATAARDPDSAHRKEAFLTGRGVTLRDMVHLRENRAEVISRAELQGPQSVATYYRGPD